MPITEKRANTWSTDNLTMSGRSKDYLMLGGRILIALIFVISGVRKITEFNFFLSYMNSFGVPVSGILLPLASGFEITLGVALALGIQTRLCGVLLFLETLLLNSIFHNYWNYPPEQRLAQFNMFLMHLAMLGGFLYVIAHGGGRLSLAGQERAPEADPVRTVRS